MIKLKHKIKEWGLAVLLALLFTLLFKLLAFQSYRVSSDKMMGTLKPGSHVLVNKFSYGIRLPITIWSLPFLDHVYSDKLQLPVTRVLKNIKVSYNDKIAYNAPVDISLPIDKRRVEFSRLIALPGDTLQIKQKKVYVNKAYQKYPEDVLFSYRLVTKGDLLDEKWYENYEVQGGSMVSEIGIYDFPLNLLQEARIDKSPEIKFVRELQEFEGVAQNNIYLPSRNYHWNKDFFGPIVVPAKGMEVVLDLDNWMRYALLIKNFEGVDIQWLNGSASLKGQSITHYEFQSNYYFVLDDNRDYAYDSRFWGFLPESHLIGRVDYVWLNQPLSLKNNWHRFLQFLMNH